MAAVMSLDKITPQPSFKLYDKFVKTINVSRTPDWKVLCPTISNLEKEHSEIICALIIHHYLLEGSNTTTAIIPYGGKLLDVLLGKGLTFTVSNMPIELQLIIEQYIMSITV